MKITFNEVFNEVFQKTYVICYKLQNNEKQKFPESVEFVPHSHFFLKREHEVEHEGSTKFAYQKIVNDECCFHINLFPNDKP